MAEKVTSMRLNEEDLEQFRAFIKDNECNNQAEAFKCLLDMVKLENTKEKLGSRGKEIEAFKDTINRAIGMYVNSLEINQTTEQTIREELNKELRTKDNTISALHEQVQDLKADKINLDNNFKDIDSKNKELQEQLQKANNEIIDKNKSIEVLTNNNINQLQQLEQYKDLKNINDKLVKELEHLKADSSTKDNTISNLENSNKKLQDKINNDSEMINFYKSNNAELKDNIKAIEEKTNKQIDNIKADHEKALQEQIKSITEQLQSKNDIEVAKKDLEIEKLKNEIEQLKVKVNKPVNKTK